MGPYLGSTESRSQGEGSTQQGSLQRLSTPTAGRLMGANSFTHDDGAPRGQLKVKNVNVEVLDQVFRNHGHT